MIDPLIGKKVLGRYRILRSLAVGGMGVIYLGRSEGAAGFAKPVVIKRVVQDFQASDDHALEYFVREATILAELRHPAIVSVVDFGDDDDAYTMVLEYVHGFHLGQWLKYFQKIGKDFPADLAIHIVCQVLDALEHAHHVVRPDGSVVQIIHRDITPSNVLVDVDGHVKLADFGIARVSTAGEEHTQSGVVRGKMPYLAPELLHGKTASTSSDVYSAAVMLHELLLGRNDFRSEIPAETVRLVLHGFASAVEPVRPDAPRGIDAVLERALAKERDARFASAAEFRSALLALKLPPADVLSRHLAEQVKHDFARMPAELGLERLEDRDAAWRNGSSAPPPPHPMFGGTPAPSEPETSHDARTQPVDVPTRAYGKIRAKDEPAPEAQAVSEMQTLSTPRSSVVSVPPSTNAAASPAEPPKSRAALVTVAMLSLAAIGIGIGAIVYTRMHRAPSTPRFIVVEHDEPATETGSGTPPAAPAQADPPRPSAGRSAASTRPATPATETATGTPLDRVTRAFASRRGAIRSCFERHAPNADPAPTVEIRFQVAADGQVEAVRLSPASAEDEPLGECILGVARATRFGDLGQPIRFSIPVTAARVSR